MRQRGRWRKRHISLDCLEAHSNLGIIAFKCWNITAKWPVEQRGPVGGWKMKHLHSGPGNEGVFLRDDSKEKDQRYTEGERGKTERLHQTRGWQLQRWSQTRFLAVMIASDCDTLRQEDHTQCRQTHTHTYLHLPTAWSLQVFVLHERPYTVSQQGLQQRSKPRRIWATGHLGVFSHVMRCGTLAGHSQRGMADLNINTASPWKPSIKQVHQGEKPHQSHSLRQTRTQIIEDTKRNYIFLV